MTEVILHIYDVTNSGSDKTNNTIVQINKIFKDGIGLGGIFHSAIQGLMSFSPLLSPNSIKNLVIQRLYPQALKASVQLLDIPLIEQVYSLFLKSGFSIDVYLGSSIIDCFSKLGNLLSAHRFLDDMPETDTVAWNTLISGYSRLNQTKDAFYLFNDLRCSGLKPDVFTLSSLVKACDTAHHNKSAHLVTLKLGFSSGAFICSGLIGNYSKVGDMESAEKCFEECLVEDTVVWTVMISGYVWNGESKMAQNIFMEMQILGMNLNQFSLTSVLGALFDIKEGKQIHCLSIKMGFHGCSSTPLSNAIMSMYCHFGSKADGIKMFYEISDPDVVSWAARIGASYDGQEALVLFKFLCSRNKDINEYTIINVLSAVGGSMLLKSGKQVQARCCKTGYLLETSVSNALISMYGSCHCIDEARRVFDEMFHRDCVSWNALLAGSADNGLIDLTLEIYSNMRHSLVEENKYTIASILEACSNSKVPEQTKRIHAHIAKLGFLSDDSMMTCLIRAYGECGEFENMMLLLSEIHRVNVVHVNAILATLVHAGFCEDALKFFQDTRESRIVVDSVTVSILLKACANLTALEQGRILHSLAVKCFIQDKFVGSSLVDVYCKCGSIDDGRMIFDELSEDNIATWNAMIMGYAQHGYIQEVFNLFNEMVIKGIGVDEITCLGFLYSCCHSGLVKKACSFLESMSEYHRVIPQIEHYACVVDLLGRVGELEEARKIIEQMPVSPDAQIWQILLSACTIHKNVELGKLVTLKLLELQPENNSVHVVLSNLHASIGEWDEVGRLRKVMKENIVHKEPGASWIQVNGTMHSFYANDTSHLESVEVRLKLLDLNNQIREKPESDDFVYGDEEWSFGFCEQGSGVFCCPPSKNPMYTYRERMVLGKTECSIFKVNQILRELSREWPGNSYDLLAKNCNHFCDELCDRLGVPKLPGWVNRFANAGDAAMEVAGNTALRLRQAKAEVVSASKVAYRFLAGVTTNSSIDSPTSAGGSRAGGGSGSPRIQSTWFKNLMSIGSKPSSSSEIENVVEDRTPSQQTPSRQNSLHSM